MSVYISHQYSVVFLSHIQFRACMVRNIWRYTSVDLSLKCSMLWLVSLYDCRLVVIFLFPFTTDSLYSFFVVSIYDCRLVFVFFPFTTVGCIHLYVSIQWRPDCIHLYVSLDDCLFAFILLFPFRTVRLYSSFWFHLRVYSGPSLGVILW
jgi:hypothetical protein